MTNHDAHPVAGGSNVDTAPAHVPLSRQAMHRKQEMLAELQAMVHRQGRRRRIARVAMPVCAAASIVLIGAVAVRLMGTSESPLNPLADGGHGIAAIDPLGRASPSSEAGTGIGAAKDVASNPRSPTYTSIKLVTASSVPSITVREFSTSKESQVVRTISDEELIAVLAQSGRNCGIIRTASHTSVVCNSCDPGETLFEPQAPKTDEAPVKPNAGTM